MKYTHKTENVLRQEERSTWMTSDFGSGALTCQERSRHPLRSPRRADSGCCAGPHGAAGLLSQLSQE